MSLLSSNAHLVANRVEPSPPAGSTGGDVASTGDVVNHPRVVPDDWHPSWCHASDVWAPADAWQRTELRQRSHEVVVKARRLGLLIEAHPLFGYRVVGHGGLPKYLHLERAECHEPPTQAQRAPRSDRLRAGRRSL